MFDQSSTGTVLPQLHGAYIKTQTSFLLHHFPQAHMLKTWSPGCALSEGGWGGWVGGRTFRSWGLVNDLGHGSRTWKGMVARVMDFKL